MGGADLDQVTYGLLGRTLGHSWSPQIHAGLGSVPYSLVELEPEELEGYVRHGRWQGLNVTIPYKRPAAMLADVASGRVRELGAANTLVRLADGRVLAENTDVDGFAWMLARFCRERLGADPRDVIAGGEVLVLGTGGASEAVRMALVEQGAQVVRVSRSGPETYDGLAARHPDARLVVNATPVGMHPHCPATPLAVDDLSRLGSLAGVLDIVYNPVRTQLVLDAEGLGIPAMGGLGMLVAQARRSSELFRDVELDDSLVSSIERRLLLQMRNVAIIGMPGAGKTGAGRHLAHLMGRPFVDLDDACTLEAGMTPARMITELGEDAFRDVESRVVSRYGSSHGMVIACGGGVVTRERNHHPLLQNSLVVMLDRPLDELSSAGRPLSGRHGVHHLAERRMPAYRSWADVVLECTGSAQGDAHAILDLIERGDA